MNKMFISILLAGLLYLACSEPTPKRNQIPILKEKLFTLQEAVVAGNSIAVDSLLSTKILDNNQSSDSLFKFVYGTDGSFAFTQFGNANIVYTNNNAWIECYVMDSTRQLTRPVTIYYVFEHDMWLVSGFKITEDSTTASE